MAFLELSVGLARNAMTEGVLDGDVKADGMELFCTSMHPSELFWRQLHYGDFDISEMSLASLFILCAAGDHSWVALPIFTSRRFFHAGILVHEDAGIEKPSDLVGKRVGVPEYQQTGAVWARAALQHEYGVQPCDVVWHMERSASQSHANATGFQVPSNIELHVIPDNTNIGEMLISGDLDATLLYLPNRSFIDRSRVDLTIASGPVRPLFADPLAEGVRYYRKTGILPANHCVVIRRSIVDQHPWIVLNVYRAFLESKEIARGRLAGLLQPYQNVGTLPEEESRALQVDPLPYGIKDNRYALDALSGYCLEQGLTNSRVPLEELFAPCTLAL